MTRISAAAEELLERACPSIQYRVRLELLGQDRSDAAMLALQEEILADPLVREVCRWRQPDGWLAWDFHGRKSVETGLRILVEKGVDPRHPVVTGAVAAVEREPGRTVRGLGTVGAALDALGFGGARTIQATVIAGAGIEDRAIVREQVTDALACFRAALEVRTADDLVEARRGRTVYRVGRRWPSLYHLRLLALTHGWRTAEDAAMLASAVGRLVDLSPLPRALVRSGSRLIAPASFCMDDFDPEMDRLDAGGWMAWFQRTELLARLGVVAQVGALRRQVERLEDLLDAGGGFFAGRVSHPYFRDWGPYTGMMLERDWRTDARRAHDLTFRSLLILGYARRTPSPAPGG